MCKLCGRVFYADGPMYRYCDECRDKAKKLQQKRSRESRKRKGKSRSPRPKPGDKCSRCGFDIIYALEYSHEENAFLCANCHRLYYHPKKDMDLSFINRRIVWGLADPSSKPLYLHGVCYLCKTPIAGVWEEHHILPRKYGGKYWDYPGNIAIICANCHRIITRAEGIIDSFFREYIRREFERLGKSCREYEIFDRRITENWS